MTSKAVLDKPAFTAVARLDSLRHFDFDKVIKEKKGECSIKRRSNGSELVFPLDGLTIQVYRSDFGGGINKRYVPCSIKRNEQCIWEFASDEHEEQGSEVRKKVAYLFTHRKDFHFIAVISGNEVLKVMRLDDLLNCKVEIAVEGKDAGRRRLVFERSQEEIDSLKQQVAAFFFKRKTGKTLPKTSSNGIRHETVGMIKRIRTIKEEKRRLEIVLSREQMKVYDKVDGEVVSGIPVTQEEWEFLPHDTKIILVGAFENEIPKGLIEHAWITRSHGKPQKKFICEVTQEKPEPKKAPLMGFPRVIVRSKEIKQRYSVLVNGIDLLRLKSRVGESFEVVLDRGLSQNPMLCLILNGEKRNIGEVEIISKS